MNTLKLEHKGSVQMVAHRGVCWLETENTAAAFVAAGNRSYFGIETDIHETADGKFIIIHDDNTKRVAGDEYIVEDTDFDTLRTITLFERKTDRKRADLVLPTLEEYISICKKYEKVAVLELKNRMKTESIHKIAKTIEELEYLEHTIFISFSLDNLIDLKAFYPNQKAQYLIEKIDDMEKLLTTLKQYDLDIDAKFECITKEVVDTFHENGMEVNVWTVNKLENAQKLVEFGADYITSNIIE